MGVGDSKVGQPQELGSQEDDGNPHDEDADTTNGDGKSRRGSRRVAVGLFSGGVMFRSTAAGRPGVYRDTEPRVVLDNKSSYHVSYWVIEEDNNINLRDKAHRERLVRSMKRYLNATNSVRRGGGTSSPIGDTVAGQEMKEPQEDEIQENGDDEDVEEGVYFLTRDHRMQPWGGTQATKVAFPLGCKKMRVCAFFEDNAKQQQWHLFLDREVSTGLLRKVFTLTASDADITPYPN